jgi:hypothetical protein
VLSGLSTIIATFLGQTAAKACLQQRKTSLSCISPALISQQDFRDKALQSCRLRSSIAPTM